LLTKVDVVRVVSNRTLRFVKRLVAPTVTIHKLPVVIDTTAFKKSNVPQTSLSGTFIFLTAGRFVPQKNFPLMLHAFAEVHSRLPQTRLRIFGDGPDRAKLHTIIEELKISDAVEINSWTNDLASEMRQASVYLLTSNYEGWGRVLIEAMLSELPIVTTDVGCAHEVVLPNKHGLIVPVDDKDSLVEAMVQMVSHPEICDTIRSNLQAVKLVDIPGVDIDAYAKEWAKTLNR
jgi:glycosyltransferase involved in cell wall biosynthesis